MAKRKDSSSCKRRGKWLFLQWRIRNQFIAFDLMESFRVMISRAMKGSQRLHSLFFVEGKGRDLAHIFNGFETGLSNCTHKGDQDLPMIMEVLSRRSDGALLRPPWLDAGGKGPTTASRLRFGYICKENGRA